MTVTEQMKLVGRWLRPRELSVGTACVLAAWPELTELVRAAVHVREFAVHGCVLSVGDVDELVDALGDLSAALPPLEEVPNAE